MGGGKRKEGGRGLKEKIRDGENAERDKKRSWRKWKREERGEQGGLLSRSRAKRGGPTA